MKNLLINQYVVFFVILFAIVSCNEKNQKEEFKEGITPASTYYQPSKLMDSLTNVFLDSAKCNDCMNELYIDKVTIKETYFTFRATTYHPKYHNEYLVEQNPLFYFIKNGQKFFVMMGAEEYIIGNQDNTKKLIFSEKNRTKTEFEILIKFKVFENTVSMQQVAGMPFMPEFNQFVPNFDSIKKFDPKIDYSQ